MKSPILFIVFNRPDVTIKSFRAIRIAKPARLYIAADGPRNGKDDDEKMCNLVREIVLNIDWPCHVERLYRDKNLGPKVAPAQAISWFFSKEQQGIILEDDVEPLPCFFDFCDLMLEYYRDDESIGLISGGNLISSQTQELNESYFFSRYASIWGWASWARVWGKYDIAMNDLKSWASVGGLKRLSRGNYFVESFWGRILKAVQAGQVNTWDYQFNFTLWLHDMVAVIPKKNLTLNIGFGEDATHTQAMTSEFMLKYKVENFNFPIVHPRYVELNDDFDRIIERDIFHISLKSYLYNKIFNIKAINLVNKKFKNYYLRFKLFLN